MKMRNGFVSNSSSTTFACDLCNFREAGWDSSSIEDYGLIRCPEGHCVCREHINRTSICDGECCELEDMNACPAHHSKETCPYATKYSSGDYYLEYEPNTLITKQDCPICNPEKLATIGVKLNDGLLLEYLLNKYNLDKEAARLEAKEYLSNKETKNVP